MTTDLEVFKYVWNSNGVPFWEWTEPNASYPGTALEWPPDSPFHNPIVNWFEFDSRGKFVRALP